MELAKKRNKNEKPLKILMGKIYELTLVNGFGINLRFGGRDEWRVVRFVLCRVLWGEGGVNYYGDGEPSMEAVGSCSGAWGGRGKEHKTSVVDIDLGCGSIAGGGDC